jgi:hypothetical protein
MFGLEENRYTNAPLFIKLMHTALALTNNKTGRDKARRLQVQQHGLVALKAVLFLGLVHGRNGSRVLVDKQALEHVEDLVVRHVGSLRSADVVLHH